LVAVCARASAFVNALCCVWAAVKIYARNYCLNELQAFGISAGMEKASFPEWARMEIARLRSEADAIQRTLDLYTEASLRQPAPSTRSRSVEPARARTSKYEPLFLEFEKTGRTLTTDDMLEIANRMNIPIDRSNMRSQVFAQKQAGRAHPDGDGYRWGLSPTETKTATPDDTGDAV
jgi:hypothetical protein